MANTSSLLKKGAPPAREPAASVIEADPRREEGRRQPLQVKIPQEVHQAFSARAGKEFGFTSGSKTKLFLAMWEAYRSKQDF